MSEWEEFAAYRGIIADAKREERERILGILRDDCHKYDENTICPCGAITPDQYDYVEQLIKED